MLNPRARRSSTAKALTGLIPASLLFGAASAAGDGDSLFFADENVCPKDVIVVPESLSRAHGGAADAHPVRLAADRIELLDSEAVLLTGDAQVVRGAQGLFAERIEYHRDDDRVDAQGGVTLHEPGGDRFEMDSLTLEMGPRTGSAERVRFQLAERGGEGATDAGPRARMRGEAGRVHFEGRDRQRLEDVSLTHCREGQDAVFIKATKVTLNHATGVGVGTNMSVRFLDVPIWYLPKAGFPINDERKTGFLFPSFGNSERSGAIVDVPYYFNIAPHKDATAVLTYLSKRGVQLRGEYRYLGENHSGSFRGEFLAGDDVFGDDRYAWSHDHTHRFGAGWQVRLDAQDVSDVEYTDDFRNELDIGGSSFLRQRAELRYDGERVDFNARLQDYVRVDPSLAESRKPHELAPRLAFSARTPRSFTGGLFELGVDSQFTRFSHAQRVAGDRLYVAPYVSMSLESVYGYVRPGLRLKSAGYDLDNTDPGRDRDPSFSVPVFTLDAGIGFERELTLGGRRHVQTLEPRLFYARAAREDQDDVPVFDTGGGNLSNIGNYYRDNRFFGIDRVEDANRVTLGLTSRLLDAETGRQRMKAELAQIFFLDDRETTLPGEDARTADTSDLLADFRAEVTRRWRAGGSLRYSHETRRSEAIRLDAAYRRDARRRVSLGYSWDRNASEQVDFEAHWPLGRKWQLSLTQRFELNEGERLSSALSLVHDACCWAARVSGETRRRHDARDETFVLFSLELKGLGKFSSFR